jgi:hypothetical protein
MALRLALNNQAIASNTTIPSNPRMIETNPISKSMFQRKSFFRKSYDSISAY